VTSPGRAAATTAARRSTRSSKAPRPATSAKRAQPAYRLDPDRVHAWRLERQLLVEAKAASPAEVAGALVGVQAQVTSSAALAIALRSSWPRGKEPAVAATAKALADRTLVRSWAMRGTLHLFAADDVPTIAAALGRRERWRRPAWLRWFGVSEQEMERLIDTIGEVLDDGTPRTRAELSVEVGARLGEKAGSLLLGSWGSALKIASDYNYLVQSAGEGAGVRFVRASRWISGWRDEDADEALARIVERYLAAYGPATQKELLRWWGVATVSMLRPALESLGESLTEVEVSGVRALARTADLEAIESTRPTKGRVRLVGGFDPFIVGAGLREDLIPAKHLKRVSRTAGWISPVVLVDGVAAGVWDAARSRDGLTITIEPFAAQAARQRASWQAAAAEIGRVQGVPASVRFGRVFQDQRSKVPFKDR
jgi:winged helix DNA-binding protein